MTNEMIQTHESGSMHFGFVELRIIHPLGCSLASFRKASYKRRYSGSVQCGAALIQHA